MSGKARPVVFVSGHVSEVYGPVQALRHHLFRRGFSFTFLTHPFPYSGLAASLMETGRAGRLVETRRLAARRSSQVPAFLVQFLVTLWRGWNARSDLFIGIGNLNALAGLVLKFFGRRHRVCYYVIDHTPRRFASGILDWIYRAVDRLCCRYCDVLWCLSDRISAAKQERGAPAGRCKLVPVGVQLDEVVMAGPARRRPEVLVAMSHLTREKGIQLVLESFRGILDRFPAARLEIIGTGPYEGELRRLADRLKLSGAVKFLGLMDHAGLFRHLPTCGIGLATYTEDKDNIAYFADPTKPKEYLACGLPVVITRVPWIWEGIADARAPMGIAIGYSAGDLAGAALKLLKDRKFYGRCRRNALDFAAGLRWGGIFDRAFRETEA